MLHHFFNVIHNHWFIFSAIQTFIDFSYHWKNFQNSSPFEKISENECDELCFEWKLFADAEMKWEKEEIDKQVEQDVNEMNKAERQVILVN